MNYKDLEIWKLSRELVIDIHKMTLGLPKIEAFEEGQQIRRSMKSVKSAIVEGYADGDIKMILLNSWCMHMLLMTKRLITWKLFLKSGL